MFPENEQARWRCELGFSVLSADMTADEKVSTAKLLFHSGKKDEAFSVLLNAYSSLKEK